MKKILVAIMLAVLLAALAIACVACAEETGAQYKERIKKEYIDDSLTQPKGGIVFLGDSITDIYETENYYKEYKVINRGISGDTTTKVLARMQDTCLIMQPKIIILLIGVNDMVSIDNDAIDGTEKILKEIFAANPETKVVVQSVYPVNKTPSKKFKHYTGKVTNEMIINHNKLLEPLAQKYGCIYVDMHSELLNENKDFAVEYTYDGLHPNLAGYRVITNKLKPIVDRLAKECGII